VDADVAFARWVDALNRPGDPLAVARALADDAVIERHGFGATRGQLVQTIAGIAAATAWVALLRPALRFSCDPARAGEAGAFVARYRVTGPDDFVGGGEWAARLAADGKIAWLRHVPDDL